MVFYASKQDKIAQIINYLNNPKFYYTIYRIKKAPVEKAPFTDTFDASKPGRVCPGTGKIKPEDLKDIEDCLHLSIHTLNVTINIYLLLILVLSYLSNFSIITNNKLYNSYTALYKSPHNFFY